jgi:hypothetical protein
MRPSAFYALLLFFALLYTQGLWSRVGVPDRALDAVLFALPWVVLLNKHGSLGKPPPGFLLVWFYAGWSWSACLYTGEGAIRGLLFARYLIAAYLVFWAIWNSDFTARQLSWIHTIIFAAFLVQVPAACFEWLVRGRLVEATVGVLGSTTGGIATSFPMFAFSCMLAFFLYYSRLIFLLAAFSFFLVGSASGKLAIYYFLPTMLVLGFVLYAAAEGVRQTLRRAVPVALLAVCAFPLLMYLLSHSRRTEMLQEQRGVRDKIGSFLAYSQATALSDQSWYTGSRYSTSRRIIEETFRRSPSVFLFGQGTHVFQEASGEEDGGAYDEYGIIYGIVGWGQDALAVGWPAMFAHVGFYAYLFWLLRKRKRTLRLDTYWKAIFLTVELWFCVFLLTYFLYSPHFTVGGWLSSVYLYFLAVLLAPQYRTTISTPPGTQGPLVLSPRSWLPWVPVLPR